MLFFKQVSNKFEQKYKLLKTLTASLIGLYIGRRLYCYIYRTFNKYPPGPNGLPFIGHLFSMINPIKLNAYLATTYGSICMIYVAQQPFVFLNSIDLITEILNNPCALERADWSKASVFSYLEPHELPVGFVNSPFWMKKRKIVQSALLSRLDSEFLNNAHNKSVTEVLIQSIRNNCIKKDKLWYPSKDLEYIMLNAIWNACFGSDLPCDNSEIQGKIKKFIFRGISQIQIDNAMMHMSDIWSHEWFKSFSFSLKDFADYIETQIYEKLGYDENIWNMNDSKWTQHFQHVQHDKNSCLISKFIAIHRHKSNITSTKNALLAEISLALFGAGIETTQNVAEYGLILLAKYPKYQSLIYKEIYNILGNDWKMEQISFKSVVHKLHYLRAFVHETVRLSNVVPISIPHRNNKTIWTKDKKYKIPRNSVIVPGVHIVDRSDAYWIHKTNGKPNSLCLEAWLDEKRHFSYLMNKDKMMGFSTGSRDCPGRALALRSIYQLFIKLILNLQFKIEDEDIKIKQMFVFTNHIHPKIGLSVTLR